MPGSRSRESFLFTATPPFIPSIIANLPGLHKGNGGKRVQKNHAGGEVSRRSCRVGLDGRRYGNCYSRWVSTELTAVTPLSQPTADSSPQGESLDSASSQATP